MPRRSRLNKLGRRQIGRKLASVETLTEVEARLILPLEGMAEPPALDA
jgi:hypothetical protein